MYDHICKHTQGVGIEGLGLLNIGNPQRPLGQIRITKDSGVPLLDLSRNAPKP